MAMNKMTEQELAAKLARLIKALEDRQTGREMLAEADRVVAKMTSEIGRAHPVIRALFAKSDEEATPSLFSLPTSHNGRYYNAQKTYVPMTVWGDQTVDYLKSVRVAMKSDAVGRHFGVKPGVMYARLDALARKGRLTKFKSGVGRGGGVTFQAITK